MGGFTPCRGRSLGGYAASKPLMLAIPMVRPPLILLMCVVCMPFSTAAGAQQAGTAEAGRRLPDALTLEQAEAELLERSLPLLAAKYQIDAAEAGRRVAALRLNPTLQVSAEQLPFYSPAPGTVPNFWRTTEAAAMPTYTAELGQVFERGGKRQLRSEQAGFQVEAMRAQSMDVLREQLLRLRQSFTAALLAQANLKLAEETDGQYAETERLMEARLRGGEIAEVDLDRVRAARLPYLQAVLESRIAYNQAAQQLLEILGESRMQRGGRTPELAGSLAREVRLPPLGELLTVAAAERPDLKIAQAQWRAAETGTRLAEAGRKRDITATALMQRTGQDYAVGASVSVPLFWFNNQKAGIAQAAATERAAAAAGRLAALRTESEVERAYDAAQLARQALDLYSKEALERSRSIRSIITYSYQRGEADLLELLEAQRSANQILAAYNQAQAGYLNAVWMLQFAVGRSF